MQASPSWPLRDLTDPDGASLRLMVQVAWEPRLQLITLKQKLSELSAVDVLREACDPNLEDLFPTPELVAEVREHISGMSTLMSWQQDGKPAHLVVGILSTKDLRDLLTPLAPHVAGLHALAIPGEPSSLSADGLADAARKAGIETVFTAASAQAAIDAIVRAETTPSRILIGGSLYLAGVVLSENG